MPSPSVVDDLYAVLDLDRTATNGDVTRAYRQLALSFHPAAGTTASSDADFNAITRAFVTLSDEKKRALYDAKPQQQAAMEDIDAAAVFKRVFGTANVHAAIIQSTTPQSAQTPTVTAPPLVANVFVRLEELYCGGQVPCALVRKVRHIDGVSVVANEMRFSIAVGRGWRDGTTLTYPRRGHFDGELVVKLATAKHPHFTRRGDDLIIRRACSLADALIGHIQHITTLDGRKLAVAVTALASPTAQHTVAGEGMPTPNGTSKGNLILNFDVAFPTAISGEHHHDIRRILRDD